METLRAQRQYQRLGRNDPCHCGSGKKYKHCHGNKSGSRLVVRQPNDTAINYVTA